MSFPVAPGTELPYYGSYPLSGNASISHAVVVVHGNDRRPLSNFNAMLRAAEASGSAAQTMVVVPYFQVPEDHPSANEPRWTNEGWKQGDNAISPAGLSSFTVMDRILAALADRSRFPRLTRITLVGHSAGGQFTQRYAATGRAPSAPGLTVNYVVANASSYLYLTADRPDLSDPAGRRFAVPSARCSYNAYKYGLDDVSAYMADRTAVQIIHQYINQKVTYLIGSADTETGGSESHELDTTCPAEIQGTNRLQRATLYYAYLRTYFPAAKHNLVLVPAVGHSNNKMFGSAQGVAVLFGDLAPS